MDLRHARKTAGTFNRIVVHLTKIGGIGNDGENAGFRPCTIRFGQRDRAVARAIRHGRGELGIADNRKTRIDVIGKCDGVDARKIYAIERDGRSNGTDGRLNAADGGASGAGCERKLSVRNIEENITDGFNFDAGLIRDKSGWNRDIHRSCIRHTGCQHQRKRSAIIQRERDSYVLTINGQRIGIVHAPRHGLLCAACPGDCSVRRCDQKRPGVRYGEQHGAIIHAAATIPNHAAKIQITRHARQGFGGLQIKQNIGRHVRIVQNVREAGKGACRRCRGQERAKQWPHRAIC